jgi:hypothetical protein
MIFMGQRYFGNTPWLPRRNLSQYHRERIIDVIEEVRYQFTGVKGIVQTN